MVFFPGGGSNSSNDLSNFSPQATMARSSSIFEVKLPIFVREISNTPFYIRGPPTFYSMVCHHLKRRDKITTEAVQCRTCRDSIDRKGYRHDFHWWWSLTWGLLCAAILIPHRWRTPRIWSVWSGYVFFFARRKKVLFMPSKPDLYSKKTLLETHLSKKICTNFPWTRTRSYPELLWEPERKESGFRSGMLRLDTSRSKDTNNVRRFAKTYHNLQVHHLLFILCPMINLKMILQPIRFLP